MSKIDQNDILKRIEETENVLLNDLHLKENLSALELCKFYEKFIPYLMHSGNNELTGRTPETLKKNINKYVVFCRKVGLTEREIIQSIEKFPSILHTFDDSFVDKYVLLSVIENEDNTLRKNKLINNPRHFSIDIKTIYARYMLMESFDYPMVWSNLVKATNNEFASIFVKNGYNKTYKVFESIDDVMYTLKTKYPVDYSFLEELKKSDKNSFLFNGGGYAKK